MAKYEALDKLIAKVHADEKLKAEFYADAKKGHVEDCVDFLFTLQVWIKKYPKGNIPAESAGLVTKKYFTAGGKNEINIDSTLRKSISKTVADAVSKKTEIPISLFEKPKSEMYKLLFYDTTDFAKKWTAKA